MHMNGQSKGKFESHFLQKNKFNNCFIQLDILGEEATNAKFPWE
jgi:hypothetical protein